MRILGFFPVLDSRSFSFLFAIFSCSGRGIAGAKLSFTVTASSKTLTFCALAVPTKRKIPIARAVKILEAAAMRLYVFSGFIVLLKITRNYKLNNY
jgi:hypothetical protein